MSRANDPSCPVTEASKYEFCGLTIREHFAGLAMQGMLAGENSWPESSTSARDLAVNAVKVADALIAELAK